MRFPLRATLILAALLTVAACARMSRPGEPLQVDESERAPSHVELSIDNHNWSDVVVSLEHDGRRNRIGIAKAAAVTKLHVPAIWLGASHTVRLVAHRIGSRSEFRSEGFAVQFDQIIDWTLENDLQLSSVALR